MHALLRCTQEHSEALGLLVLDVEVTSVEVIAQAAPDPDRIQDSSSQEDSDERCR